MYNIPSPAENTPTPARHIANDRLDEKSTTTKFGLQNRTLNQDTKQMNTNDGGIAKQTSTYKIQ